MRLGITTDVDGWCIAEHAAALQKYAPHGLDVDVRTLEQSDHKWRLGCDVCYDLYLGGTDTHHRPKRLVASVGSHSWMHTEFDPSNWRTRGVNKTRNHARGATLLARLDAVTCRNQALGRLARPLCKSVGVFPGGIDPDIYHPATRLQNQKLRIGFCGQVGGNRDADFKGAAEIFQPLAERLGDRYEFVSNTRTHATRLSQAEMVRYFQGLDVFLCCASADATPIPPFQAAACGAILLSTRVGQIADWKTLHMAGLGVPDYGNESEAAVVIDEIANRLAWLEDSVERRAVSELLMLSIEREYSYKVLAPKTLSFVCGVPL